MTRPRDQTPTGMAGPGLPRVLALSAVGISLVLANPFVVTFLSEFSADSSSQWLEIHALPSPMGPTDLTDWEIKTSTSACTLDCVLGYDDYLIVDSAALAEGRIGRGTFRLRPDSDSIVVLPLEWPPEAVCYPRLPSDRGEAPCPPQRGSVSFWNYHAPWEQTFNWYVDSSPTPGAENDDFSAVAGTVLVESLPIHAELFVYARGRYGACCTFEGYQTADFAVQGLGAGWFALEAVLCSPHGNRQGFYPESVYVGYGQTLSGILIDLRQNAIRGGPEPSLMVPPTLKVAGTAATVSCAQPTDVRFTLLDQTGSRKAVLRRGRLGPGVYRFDLSQLASPGVYFARLEAGPTVQSAKVVIGR